MVPFVGNLLAIKAYSPKIGIGIVATYKDCMCILVNTVEMCYSGKVTFSAISVTRFVSLSTTIVPVIGACRFGAYCSSIAIGLIEYGVDGFSCCPFKNGKELISAVNLTTAIAPGFAVVATLYFTVGASRAYVFSCTVSMYAESC